jgi:hypothetical protein
MAKEKQKICSHCEGRISVEADTCLYCGMPLVVESANASSALASSLYSPPYKAKAEQEPVAKFSTVSKEESSLGGIAIPAQMAAEEEKEDSSGFIALFLALIGSTLFILGLMQGLFSENGMLRLEWNCKYWFLFCLFSLPILYIGIKKSKVS